MIINKLNDAFKISFLKFDEGSYSVQTNNF